MTSTVVEKFCDSLADHNATSSVIQTSALHSELDSRLTGPAVGVPLALEDVSLSGLPITLDPTPTELENATFGVTSVELGIATYGTVAIRSDTAGSEVVSLFANTHIAVLQASDIESNVPETYDTLNRRVGDERSSLVLATGPSATADMGGLVYGAHGPANVHVVILSDR